MWISGFYLFFRFCNLTALAQRLFAPFGATLITLGACHNINDNPAIVFSA